MSAQLILYTIKKYDEYMIIGHKEPDGDCIGSQLVLASFLKGQGKIVNTFSAGPFMRPEIQDKISEISTKWKEPKSENAAVIIVDCSTVNRIGYFSEYIKDYPVIVIDHHSSGLNFGDVRYINPDFPSVTLMIYEIIKLAEYKPSKKEAELLYFGFSTDTGFYRHLENTSGKYLKMAAELIEWGASPKKAFREMYGHRSFESRALIGTVLCRIERHADNKIISTYMTNEDKQNFNGEELESDTLYQLIQGIQNVEVIILMREEENIKTLNVGLRSYKVADVGKVASDLGGGGHARAAGCTVEGSIESVKEKLLKIITPLV